MPDPRGACGAALLFGLGVLLSRWWVQGFRIAEDTRLVQPCAEGSSASPAAALPPWPPGPYVPMRTPGVLIVGRTKPETMWFYPDWWGKEYKCGRVACRFSKDAEGADVLAFSGSRAFPGGGGQLGGVPKLAFGKESPVHHFGGPLGDFASGVNYSVSYDPRSSLYHPVGFLISRGQSWSKVDQDIYRPGASQDWQSMQSSIAKRKGVLVVMSNCRYDQSGRNWYIRALSNFTQVDYGGACSRKAPLARAVGSNPAWQQYRFYLAFENSRCKNYITEKFFRSLLLGMIPIALGAPREDYEAVAERGSFLHVEDFASPQELALQIERLMDDDSAAMALHDWRRRWDVGQVEAKRMPCLFCRALSGDPVRAPATFSSRGAPYSRMHQLNASDLPNQKRDCRPSLAPPKVPPPPTP